MKQQITPWEVLSSTISYEDQWLKVRSDKCRTPQGHVITPYHVLECLTWVNVIALTPDGKIVLVREYRHGAQQILLGLPGGGVEPGEQALAAIQRELLEETGYSEGRFFEIGHCYANPANQNNTVWSFLALDVVKTHEQHLDDGENIEIILQDFVDFSRQAWSGELPAQAMHLAALGFATQFILRSDHPQLQMLRTKLLQA